MRFPQAGLSRCSASHEWRMAYATTSRERTYAFMCIYCFRPWGATFVNRETTMLFLMSTGDATFIFRVWQIGPTSSLGLSVAYGLLLQPWSRLSPNVRACTRPWAVSHCTPTHHHWSRRHGACCLCRVYCWYVLRAYM